jgi:hypothetical protein
MIRGHDRDGINLNRSEAIQELERGRGRSEEVGKQALSQV